MSTPATSPGGTPSQADQVVSQAGRRRVPTKALLLALLALSLVLAGVVSYYASAAPDGLERVATDLGFLDSASEHAAAGSPLADYQVAGVANSRVSGGLAGIAGTLLVLVLSAGLFLLVGRRRPTHG